MNNDKTYIMFGLRTDAKFTSGVGHVFTINLLTFLGHKFNKYRAFNIKLETTPAQLPVYYTNPLCFQLKGLQWMNGYDSINPYYSDSRVLEVVQHGGMANTTSYISNANAIGFYRPSQFNVTLTFFYTDMDGVFYDNPASGFRLPLILSITGIDEYKVMNPSKGLRYNYQNKLSSILTLKYYDGTSIDPIDSTVTKGRIRLFKNINLRTIIGNEIYDKYNKFALVARRTFAPISLNTTTDYSGVYTFQYFLTADNILFESPSYDTNSISLINGEIPLYANPVLIGFSDLLNETYIEYIFNKPSSDLTNITICSSYALGGIAGLSTPTTTNNTLFPDMMFQFEIIPVNS